MEAPTLGQHLTACTSNRDLAVLAIEDGDAGRARHYAQHALDYADTLHLNALHQMAVAHSVLGMTMIGDDPGSARRHVERGVVLARRSNRPIMLAYALAARAQVELVERRTDAARGGLAEARNVLRRCPDPAWF